MILFAHDALSDIERVPKKGDYPGIAPWAPPMSMNGSIRRGARKSAPGLIVPYDLYLVATAAAHLPAA